MSFGQALEECKQGYKILRAGWNGKGMWIGISYPAAGSEMGHPYLYMKAVDGNLFPWNPNQLDMLSEDWHIL